MILQYYRLLTDASVSISYAPVPPWPRGRAAGGARENLTAAGAFVVAPILHRPITLHNRGAETSNASLAARWVSLFVGMVGSSGRRVAVSGRPDPKPGWPCAQALAARVRVNLNRYLRKSFSILTEFQHASPIELLSDLVSRVDSLIHARVTKALAQQKSRGI